MPQLYENAKLLVCCADILFGLDVRSRCVVLSSLQVPPHFFTQKSALSTSGIHSTDTGVYYVHIRDAGGDLRPLRRRGCMWRYAHRWARAWAGMI
jgi:hypothetical protein